MSDSVEAPTATVVSGGGIRAFTPGQVAFATFLGSPLAGGIAMAINKRRAGQPAAMPVIAGIAMTLVLLVVGFALPGNIGNFVPIVGVVAMLSYARAEHPKLGTTVPASSWGAAGLGLAGLAIAAVTIVGVVILQEPPSITFGPGQEIRYTGGATEAEARTTGDALKAMGWFQNQESTVQIAHANGKLEMSFVLQDGAWDRRTTQEAFATLRPLLEEQIGQRIVIRLCDDELEMHRVVE